MDRMLIDMSFSVTLYADGTNYSALDSTITAEFFVSRALKLLCFKFKFYADSTCTLFCYGREL